MKQKRDFTQYVHEFTNDDGVTRYAVARWDQDKGQFVRPLDDTEAKATGCMAEFARRAQGVQNYADRRRALRRARYLFYETDKEYQDWLAELQEETARFKG